jgi:hypothetical protein
MILMRMGVCEFLFFETIPPKVTINEYIDLAKEYSTQQSGQFVNGILDNIHKELVQQGWRTFLVKVHNPAGANAPLRLESPNVAPIYKKSMGSPNPPSEITPNDVPGRWPDAEIKNISVSDDGKVAFETGANNIPRTGFPDFVTAGVSQVFVWDRFTGDITLISRAMGGTPGDVANGISEHPRISGDGQFVAFASGSNNLTADPTNGRRQIYLSASDGSSIELVSRATGAAGATSDEHCARPCLNVDGTVVAFQVQNNVVGPGTLIPGVAEQLVVRRNVLTDVTDLIGLDPFLFSFGSPAGGLPMAISDDGEFATWLKTAGNNAGIVVKDMIRGREILASFTLVPASGTVLELPFSTISGDGIWVFWSSETEFQVLGDTNNAADIFGFGPLR